MSSLDEIVYIAAYRYLKTDLSSILSQREKLKTIRKIISPVFAAIRKAWFLSLHGNSESLVPSSKLQVGHYKPIIDYR